MEPKQEKQNKVPLFSRLQMKYAMSYLVIFAVVLVLLNTYPVIASQNLLFSSKKDSLSSQTAVMASTLMELESLSSDQVVRVMNMLDDMGLSRILVTDPAGRVLYDSERDEAEGQPQETTGNDPQQRYALLQEVVLALQGKDVFYSRYTGNAFVSSAAVPIVYRGMIIGSIYILEVDAAQGALLRSLQHNLASISIVIAAITLVLSTLFSAVLTGRIGALLRAIRIVGEGEYGHRLQPVGRDELAQLAGEFNNLTDRLQETEEMRRRFVSDASHELKTPLASIRLLADSILQNEPMEPELVRDFVTDIGNEADRLTRTTEHLLALSRLDSQSAVQTCPVDVAAVVERAAAMLAPVAEEAAVTICISKKPDCIIGCTEDDLYQICYNLMENAIKYNCMGGYVDVSVGKDDEQVLIEVMDTGIGIPEEDLPKVFNRFYRVDKARSRAGGGTGLGLAIVRDTVRRHGGWVTAQRRNPAGSIFTVGFPQYIPGEEEEEAWP